MAGATPKFGEVRESSALRFAALSSVGKLMTHWNPIESYSGIARCVVLKRIVFSALTKYLSVYVCPCELCVCSNVCCTACLCFYVHKHQLKHNVATYMHSLPVCEAACVCVCVRYMRTACGASVSVWTVKMYCSYCTCRLYRQTHVHACASMNIRILCVLHVFFVHPHTH